MTIQMIFRTNCMGISLTVHLALKTQLTAYTAGPACLCCFAAGSRRSLSALMPEVSLDCCLLAKSGISGQFTAMLKIHMDAVPANITCFKCAI